MIATKRYTALLGLLGILIGAQAGFAFDKEKALNIAQGNEELSDSSKIEKPVAHQLEAYRVEPGAVSIDGRLEESAWEKANTATGFIQHSPNSGEPASQITEVKFLYDDDYLYIGARMCDTNPD